MEQSPFENRIDIQAIQDSMYLVKREVAKVVVGQESTIELMLAAILSNGHILLEGVPGVAKTLTAKLIAKTIDVGFSRIQFTPDLMPSDVMGTNVFNPQTISFEFKRGPIFSNIILIDEINRAPAKTQAALFEVMEERTITIDGTSYVLDQPFMVIATQNPVEHEGTYQLPEAQLDRFAFKLIVHYPDHEQEVEILQRHQKNYTMHSMIDQVKKVLDKEHLTHLRELVSRISVEEKLLSYIAQIVQQTRTHGGLLLGASPRASVTILNTAKALASLRGRDFVTPDDIVQVALPALRHRISLSAEKEMDGSTTDDVVNGIIKGIEIPR
ncbi:MAG: MoxR family ATPase [Chitinophagaceae bacterium]|nr:MoxR family ATPase [Chitinophagaceae bacterium]